MDSRKRVTKQLIINIGIFAMFWVIGISLIWIVRSWLNDPKPYTMTFGGGMLGLSSGVEEYRLLAARGKNGQILILATVLTTVGMLQGIAFDLIASDSIRSGAVIQVLGLGTVFGGILGCIITGCNWAIRRL